MRETAREYGPLSPKGRKMIFPPSLVWAFFAVLVVLATAPIWRLAVFGLSPALDDFLAFVCSASQ
jgi:hypothetical protein